MCQADIARQVKNEGSQWQSLTRRALGLVKIAIARHVLPWRCSQETRVRTAFDDVAGSIYQSLDGGHPCEPHAERSPEGMPKVQHRGRRG